MDTYRNIESPFSDYFADDVEPVLRYASLRKPDTEENIEKQMAPAYNHAMAREENNGNQD